MLKTEERCNTMLSFEADAGRTRPGLTRFFPRLRLAELTNAKKYENGSGKIFMV